MERFSEDIDILVIPGGRGRSATDTLMKNMGRAAAAGVCGEALPFGGSETGRHRSFQVTYPASRQATAVVETTVLLEMGVRGGNNPHEQMAIGSLLGDVLEANGTDLAEHEDLERFDLLVLHPGRTLLEKLVHIHGLAQELASDESREADLRSGRHFYDVYQLLGEGRVLDLLVDREQVEKVIGSILDVTRAHFGGGDSVELRPEGGFAISPAFDPNTTVSRRLSRAYDATMPELYYGADPVPTWDAICDRVADHRELL